MTLSIWFRENMKDVDLFERALDRCTSLPWALPPSQRSRIGFWLALSAGGAAIVVGLKDEKTLRTRRRVRIDNASSLPSGNEVDSDDENCRVVLRHSVTRDGREFLVTVTDRLEEDDRLMDRDVTTVATLDQFIPAGQEVNDESRAFAGELEIALANRFPVVMASEPTADESLADVTPDSDSLHDDPVPMNFSASMNSLVTGPAFSAAGPAIQDLQGHRIANRKGANRKSLRKPDSVKPMTNTVAGIPIRIVSGLQSGPAAGFRSDENNLAGLKIRQVPGPGSAHSPGAGLPTPYTSSTEGLPSSINPSSACPTVAHDERSGIWRSIHRMWESLPDGVRLMTLAAVAATFVWLAWSQFGPGQNAGISGLQRSPAARSTGAAESDSNLVPVSYVDSGRAGDANPLPPSTVNNIPLSVFNPAQNPDWRLKTLNIEEIRVGMRVPALNPQGIQSQPDASARDLDQKGSVSHGVTEAQSETAFGNPDPKTWRTFRLQVEKEDRTGDLEVTLLRPADWLVEQQQSTVLLAMLAQWQLAEEESSAPIGFSSAVETLEALARFDPQAEVLEALSFATEFATPIQYFHSTDPLRGLVGIAFSEFKSAVVEQAEADLLWCEAVEAVLSGETTGSQIWLEMPELGAVGLATVTAIESCPTIKSGPGRIVTATFKHASAEVLDLKFSSAVGSAVRTNTFNDPLQVRTADPTTHQPSASSLSLGVTVAHPFWSVDREDFIPAGELLPQEQVIGIDSQHFRLTSITPRAGPETVYNFEVALDHVYYVGEGGVLVHNAYLTGVRWPTVDGRANL